MRQRARAARKEVHTLLGGVVGISRSGELTEQPRRRCRFRVPSGIPKCTSRAACLRWPKRALWRAQSKNSRLRVPRGRCSPSAQARAACVVPRARPRGDPAAWHFWIFETKRRPIPHGLSKYSMRGSSPRPMAHKTIALATELMEPCADACSRGRRARFRPAGQQARPRANLLRPLLSSRSPSPSSHGRPSARVARARCWRPRGWFAAGAALAGRTNARGCRIEHVCQLWGSSPRAVTCSGS